MSWHIRPDCRLCGSTTLNQVVLELAPTPPANEFVRAEDPPQELIPLYLAQCAGCGHVQLPVVVDPVRLFRNYVYVSGTSPSFVEHFRRYAEDCVELLNLRENDLVVDIGSNDGTLLRQFKNLGMSVCGVDPAVKIALEATESGIPTTPEFFTRKLANELRWGLGRQAALVVANNVFAHADDLKDIALGVRDLLEPTRGRFVFEVQYLVNMLDRTLFDMIYHEHLSYHSLAPLVTFFDSIGMTLTDVQTVSTHGGSIRCEAAPHRGLRMSNRLTGLLDIERIALAGRPFESFKHRIEEASVRLRGFIASETSDGKVIAGYGAPAKLTTLCHEFGVTGDDISYVVDDSPWKRGLFTPGTRIPVVEYGKPQPDAFIIFAWNFSTPIAKKLREGGFTGKIVTPLPIYQEIA